MKQYAVVKSISHIMIMFAVFAVLFSGLYLYLGKNQIGADTTTQTSSFSTGDYLYAGYAGISSQIYPTNVKLGQTSNLSFSASSVYATRMSLFISDSTDYFKLTNLASAPGEICAMANSSSSYMRMFDTTACSGDACKLDFTWKPSSAGSHQIFAVLMKGAAPCKAEDVLGWTDTSANFVQVVDPTASEASGNDPSKIKLKYDPPSLSYEKGATVNINVDATAWVPSINHISLLVARDDTTTGKTFASTFSRSALCEQAEKKTDCLLCFQKRAECKDGKCNVSWTPTEAGKHQIYVVAMSSAEDVKCAPANVLGWNANYIATVKDSSASGGESGSDTKELDWLRYGSKPGTSTPSGFGATIANLTKPISSLGDLASKVVNILLFAIGAMSVISIIVGGIMYISSGGDQQKAEKGKKTLIYAVFGIAIATLGLVIESAVIDLINNQLFK